MIQSTGNLATESLELDLTGAGEAEVHANQLLSVTITGSGSLIDAD